MALRPSIPTGETNPVSDIGGIHVLLDQLDRSAGIYPLTDHEVVSIERLRLIGYNRSEYPYWDVSYCYGRLADGRLVRVDIGADRVRGQWRSHLVELCQEAKRYGKGLGILDAVSLLPG
ncbi:hypothetical protein [Nocardiopsis synnemataformans]|uniref:hypothetical protein n=1 Tax=Nocardiopsis synnemataformans TaxID=61305 RepID=UPI003EBFF850